MLEKRLSRDCVPNDVYDLPRVMLMEQIRHRRSGAFSTDSGSEVRGAAYQRICSQAPTDKSSMSGKSTYLKQVGLLAVQAMVGCQ